MRRLEDGRMTPSLPLRSITSQRNGSTVIFWPAELMVPETDFEQLARELNPQHFDIRKRPR